MKRSLSFALAIALLILCSSCAEKKTFTHTVKRPFSGSQPPDDARIVVIVEAKRKVLEIAGTYLETMTVVKDHDVKSDDILALADGVLEAEIVSQKNYASDEGSGIIIVAKVDVDSSITDERIKAFFQDQRLFSKYKDKQRREKDLLVKIRKLEFEYNKLQNLTQNEQEEKKEVLKKELNAATQHIAAMEYRNRALDLWRGNGYQDPDKAIEYLNEAIRLNPYYDSAYINRGNAWRNKGDNDRAITDFNKAIELVPNGADAYYNRAIVLWNKREYDSACRDFRKACELGLCQGLNSVSERGYCK